MRCNEGRPRREAAPTAREGSGRALNTCQKCLELTSLTRKLWGRTCGIFTERSMCGYCVLISICGVGCAINITCKLLDRLLNIRRNLERKKCSSDPMTTVA